MATTATPWIGSFGATDKLYLQSGQFTSTISLSLPIGAVEATGNGISWDGTNTPWCGNTDDKLYLQSGQFVSTIKESQSVIAKSTYISGISFDGTNTPWSAGITQKLFLTSGQFSSTIKESLGVGSYADDISTDGLEPFWTSAQSDKLYRQSQFTSTIKDSEDVSGWDAEPVGISWDGTNTPWSGKADIKLYLQSGKFTSTLKESQTLGGVNYPESISTDDYSSRVSGIFRSVSDNLTLSDQVAETIIRVPRPIIPVNDALTFVEEAGYYSGILHPTDELEFIETVTVFNNHQRVADVLVFAEIARQPLILELTVIDTLTLSDSIAKSTNHQQSSDLLIFEEFIDLRGSHYDIHREAVEALEFTDSSTVDIHFYAFFPIDTLDFQESVTIRRPYNFTVTDELVFAEELTIQQPYNKEVITYFNWTYTPDGHPFAQRASFFESVDRQLILSRRAYDNLALVESIGIVNEKVGAVSKSVNDTLTFIEIAARVYGDIDTLTFTETILVELCKPGKDTLIFIESLTYSQQASYDLTDTLILESTVAYDLISSDTLCQYRPFVGDTTIADAPSPPRLNPPTIVRYANVQLSYPPDNPTDIITLRGPELDNRDQLHFSRISRETRGGTLIIFADEIWPQNQRLLLSFIGLSETDAQAALSFIETTIGQQIELRDWEGKEWIGVILTPDNPITRNHNCNIGFDIEFEGVPIIRDSSSDDLVLAEQVAYQLN